MSYGLADGPHYFNHAQKIFQVGEDSTLAVMFWGLGGLGDISLRTIAALLSDSLQAAPAADVADVAARWGSIIFDAYQHAAANDPHIGPAVQQWAALHAKAAHDPAVEVEEGRTADEEEQYAALSLHLTLGSCVAGQVLPDRTPAAYFLHLEPSAAVAPPPEAIAVNSYRFWGAPNMLQRLLFAADEQTKASILQSGKWTGTKADLEGVLAQNALIHPIIPLRDVVDFVHTCVHSTIKALKFSPFQQICGGPVELAVISSDRKFRWVRHKVWDAAVVDGGMT